jgi:hypothetical protein
MDARLATEIADIKKLHSKDVDFCESTHDGEIDDADEKLRLLEAALQQNVDKVELDVATEARDAGGDEREAGDQGPRLEEDAAREEREASGPDDRQGDGAPHRHQEEVRG